MKKSEVIEIIEKLKEAYPEATCSLDFETPFQLVVAVMLSAQCTDKRVNMVTKEMYKKYNTPEDFSKLSIEEIEEMVKSISYYHTKARHIKECSTQIVEEFNGKVPNNMKDLMSLSGIGRKSANVIMLEAFGESQGIAVDTHVFRIARRLRIIQKK